MEKLLFSMIVWLCATIFIGIGLYARNRKEPMWFYSGMKIDSRQIKNIPAYNRAYSRLWFRYAAPYILIGITYFWFPLTAVDHRLSAVCNGRYGIFSTRL